MARVSQSRSVVGRSTVLRTNGSLRSLDLSGNSLGSKGAQALAAGLRENVGLTQLSCSGGDVGTTGADTLLAALEHNAIVTDLSLTGSEFNWTGHARLKEVLARNKAWAANVNREILAMYMPERSHSTRVEKLAEALEKCDAARQKIHDEL